MDSSILGIGSIHADWSGVEGESGLEPGLVLKGQQRAKSYSLGKSSD